MPSAGFEADPMAHRRASQPRLAVPHDLMPGVRIVLAGAVSAEMGDEPHGVAQPVRSSGPENLAQGNPT